MLKDLSAQNLKTAYPQSQPVDYVLPYPRFFQLGWLFIALFYSGVLFFRTPLLLDFYRTTCQPDNCINLLQLTASSANELGQLGLSLDTYAILSVILISLLRLISWVVGAILIWFKPQNPCAVVLAFTFVIRPADDLVLWQDLPQLESGYRLIQFFNPVGLILLYTLFPGNRFVPSWSRWVVLAVTGYSFAYAFFIYPLPGNNPFNNLVFLAIFVYALVSQIYRYRRVSTQLERQQTRWIVYFVALSLVMEITNAVIAATHLVDNVQLLQALSFFVGNYLGYYIFSRAIFRYRLWEIDVVISRTLVYGSLTFIIVGLYILVVGGIGLVFQTGNNLVVSLGATGLIAVLFQPLRLKLQATVNRVMYGDRDNPYRVISRLGERLEVSATPQQVLPGIVETLVQALKLPYAAISFKENGGYRLVTSIGTVTDRSLLLLPLMYQGEELGQLAVAPRSRGETFNPVDMRLLNDLARQIGMAVHAVRLTTDLQRSREQLVTTREEERWRIRRDLHDGLGPALATLTLQLDTAYQLIDRNPAGARELLVELKKQTQTAIADIRRLVYRLRPPALDEMGLLGALGEQLNHFSYQSELNITTDLPEKLPPLSPAIEVAIYRIVTEALTNIVRHAGSTACHFTMSFSSLKTGSPDPALFSALSGEIIELEVRDNGRGLGQEVKEGVGLSSMRERAAELGGTCQVEPLVEGGTRVLVRLPFVIDNSGSFKEE